MTFLDAVFQQPVTCPLGTPAHRVARLMNEHQIGSVVVIDQETRPVGIVTDRDLALRVVGMERAADTAVDDVMSADMVTLSAEASGPDAAQQMATYGYRRLPVVDPITGHLVAIVTFDDVLLAAAESFDQVIRVLRAERSPG